MATGTAAKSTSRRQAPLRARAPVGAAPRGRAAAVDRNGSRAGVAEIQRARIVAALVEVAGERGVGRATVAHVVARSGVSRRTFYELFEDRQDCFLAAFEQAVEQAGRRVLPAFGVSGSWRERVRGGLGALLEWLDDEPGLGALCVVDALGGGPVALERRARVVRVLVDAVHEGCGEVTGLAKPGRLVAEGIVGAVLGVLHARLATSGARAGGVPPMASLLGPLMAMIVLPYLGSAAAARETARPSPRRRRTPHATGDPLRELDMRLTYRTVRVLLAIADLQGPSNRQVSDAAGVSDQGQISKLLARLEHLGLIENADVPSRGEPNSWRLTAKGIEVERTIRRQAVPVER